MFRIWYSTESFADFIIDNTCLSAKEVRKERMYESDASNPKKFHSTPDHIRKILYLDAPDLIIEYNNEPILSIEVTTEAGTGHNSFQRFARIAAAAENKVPAFYIYPKGAIVTRRASAPTWDCLNPLVFKALEAVMAIYNIPAFLYYFPSEIDKYQDSPESAPHLSQKGLLYHPDIARYAGCPSASTNDMQTLFHHIDEVINGLREGTVRTCQEKLLSNLVFREHREWMQREFISLSDGRAPDVMSPLSAIKMVPTADLLEYLSQYQSSGYSIGELLRSREHTIIYQVDAKFRGDPYPGALAAIDYLKCREGVTFEDRRYNLVLLFGILLHGDEGMKVIGEKAKISDFFDAVKKCGRHNLLQRDYHKLAPSEIPHYFMQVRYGSTYSKSKHIRVYSYFADAILFPDGALWRDA